ncbi:MAG: hypothetical protein RL141_780 [Candidatus Parcubacteria bacterium]|jgi:hypothetical protein
MTEAVTVKSTSRTSAETEDIILREGEKTRLVFRPMMVVNPSEPKHSIKGCFIFQKKKPSGNWDDYKVTDLTSLKDAEGVKLELHSAEVYRLLTQLNNRYSIFDKYGIKFGTNKFVLTPDNVEEVVEQLLKDPSNLEKFKSLKREDLEKINVVTNISNLEALLEVWEKNKTNASESFWQDVIKKESWVLSQVFSTPVVLFKDEAYMGGKNIGNKGGSVTDFLLKNKLTDHVLIVEVKTPETDILGAAYRGTHSISGELTGGTNQLLQQKDKLQKEFYTISGQSEESFGVINPCCLLIVGNIKKLKKVERDSFELYRRNSKDIEIITYDELFAKVQILKDLLSKSGK